MAKTLTLTLPPEVAKIMPWIISAKATRNPELIAWARREYDYAMQTARYREERERVAERRCLLREQGRQEEKERQNRAHRDWLAQKAHWETLGIHFARENGEEMLQPTQSSQKGWRRLLSEFPHLCEGGRYGAWGCIEYRSNENKRNCGRKPKHQRP